MTEIKLVQELATEPTADIKVLMEQSLPEGMEVEYSITSMETELKTYLVEFVYEGKTHEPFGRFHKTTLSNVFDSLKYEIDSKGYTEELDRGMYKFVSPRNLPSYWIVHEYVN